MTNEKFINWTENQYSVTDTGVVYSYKYNKKRELRQLDDVGYLRVKISLGGKIKNCKVHRLVAEAFLSTWDESLQVNHKDFDRQNNHVDNLEMVTGKENTMHATLGGRRRTKKGQDAWNSKLTPEQVVEIRSKRGILSQHTLAKLYGVSRSCINNIMLGVNWSHV